VTARRDLADYLAALRRRGGPYTQEHWDKIVELHGIAVAAPQYWGMLSMESLDSLAVEFEPIAREPTEPEPNELRQPSRTGGRPPAPVMPAEDARKLQEVIDVALKNGNKLVVADLARRFGISRHRIQQAIALRKTGYDLAQTPSEFPPVSGSKVFVRWPAPGEPRKS
jgi:hypothetical protein